MDLTFMLDAFTSLGPLGDLGSARKELSGRRLLPYHPTPFQQDTGREVIQKAR